MLYSRLAGWLSTVWPWSGRRFCLPKQSISLVPRPGDLPLWCRNSKTNRTKSRLLSLEQVSGNLPAPRPLLYLMKGVNYFPCTWSWEGKERTRARTCWDFSHGCCRRWFCVPSPGAAAGVCTSTGQASASKTLAPSDSLGDFNHVPIFLSQCLLMLSPFLPHICCILVTTRGSSLYWSS